MVVFLLGALICYIKRRILNKFGANTLHRGDVVHERLPCVADLFATNELKHQRTCLIRMHCKAKAATLAGIVNDLYVVVQRRYLGREQPAVICRFAWLQQPGTSHLVA